MSAKIQNCMHLRWKSVFSSLAAAANGSLSIERNVFVWNHFFLLFFSNINLVKSWKDQFFYHHFCEIVKNQFFHLVKRLKIIYLRFCEIVKNQFFYLVKRLKIGYVKVVWKNCFFLQKKSILLFLSIEKTRVPFFSFKKWRCSEEFNSFNEKCQCSNFRLNNMVHIIRNSMVNVYVIFSFHSFHTVFQCQLYCLCNVQTV